MAQYTEESLVPTTKGYEVLQRKASRLQTAISDPIMLSIDLFSKNLVSQSTLQKVNAPTTTPNAQNFEIIDSLLRAMAIDPNNFHKLLQILENHPPLLTVVGKEMKEDYESCTSLQEQKKVISVDGQNMQNKCDEILGRLAGLVLDFQKVVEKANVNIEDLKQFIILRYPDEQYRNQLRKASDINEVFAIIRSKFCSLFNYTVLLRIAERFDLPDGFKVIREYKVKEEDYRTSLSSSTLASKLQRENKLLFQNLSRTKKIILKLRGWSRPPAPTVAEFEEVIRNVFADLGDLMHLLVVTEGSIIITMCAPERVIGALIALAKRKIAYLKDIGVSSLKIGDTLIISDIEDTEELSHDVMEQDIEDKPSSPSPNMEENTSDNVDQLPSLPVGAVTGIVPQLNRPLEQAVADDGVDDTDQEIGGDSATPLVNKTWRNYPVTMPREVMIIGSFGHQNDCLKKRHIISAKILKTELSDEWGKEEIEKIAGLFSRNLDKHRIKSIYFDLPGSELPKEFYMKAIKYLFIECKQPGAILHYTGHGEKDTGNWCFKDGVISFNDIFELYMMHFKGKPLSITSDCSYSGNWINECGKRLDEMNVLSCGHHTREQGLLFNICTSCQPNEEATALCFVNEGVKYSEADKGVIFHGDKTLTLGQKTMFTDFRMIRCGKPANESCEADADCTWNDCLSNKYRVVYLVRGKDRLWDAWHYVLVDEEKLDDFKAKVATGTIDVAHYGRVLKSGWGNDPPKDIVRMISLRCGYLLKQI